MPEQVYITASCTVSNHCFFKNGQPVFESSEAGLLPFLNAAYQHFGLKYSKFHKMDSLSRPGWLATEVLLKDSFDQEKYRPEETGIVFSNANSSLDADIKYFNSVKDIPSPALFVYTLPNIVIGEISIKHNFKGENAFFIFEQFDAAFLQKYISGLFNNDTLQACIGGWVDVIGDTYKAVLFLIEKGSASGGVEPTVFTAENLNKIYELHSG